MSSPGRIWLDEAEAGRDLDARLHRGEITPQEAADLRDFAEHGYLILSVPLSGEEAAAIDADVDRLWKTKPRNVSFAYDSPPYRFSTADESRQRKPRYRIHDLHSASKVARRLYLQPLLHRYASLILGGPAVATQSLYFEYGSQQALHRDFIVVPTPVLGRLLAAWIALEDIDERSGPLAYVPGSHTIPFYEFEPGGYMFDGRRMGEREVRAAMQYHDEESARRGLTSKLFMARRGQVLLWHSALLHGGGPVLDDTITRKSLVVHYSTLAQHPTRESAVTEDGGETVWTTSEIWTADGASGFANPLDGRLAYRR